jgi:ribosomal protein S18 acetylase RimI-like enzyme
MALPDIPMRVSQRGSWPGRMSFRRGWASASARPWNDVEPDASLRLLRGGGAFLLACSDRVIECGAPSVLSPPLPLASAQTWKSAGYEEFIRLALMRLSLEDSPSPPDHLVVESGVERIDDLLEIDAAAFSSFWRFDRLGLTEAVEATGDAIVLIIRDSDGKPTGFAIVGFGSAISYLQRVAVHPQWQGQGMGRSLVRVAARKARDAGARVMLLNTQLDNEAALRLYESEGYVRVPEPLCLLRYRRSG